MYEELKARLRDMVSDNNWTGVYVAKPSLEAIEQLERQLAERDAEIAKYRDAPVVAWQSSRNGFICKENKNPEYNIPLIVKSGEQ